jgi:DNA-nicking Smr family endonuclease
MSKSVAHLDLHSIAKNSRAIDTALEDLFREAASKRLKQVEIIPGRGSGQLMKRVKKFLDRQDIKAQYKRVVVDAKNHGRLFVYFR